MSGSRILSPHRPGHVRVGPLVGQAAQRICRQSGIHAAMTEKRLISLAQLRLGLDIALRETEAARDGADFWAHALVAAGFARAICNVALDALAGRVPEPPAGRASLGCSCTAPVLADPDVFGLARMTANDAEVWPGPTPGDAVARRVDLVREGLESGPETRRSLRYVVDEHLGFDERGLHESGDEPLGRIVRVVRELHAGAHNLYGMVHSSAETATTPRALANQVRALDGRIKDLQALASDCPSPALKALFA